MWILNELEFQGDLEWLCVDLYGAGDRECCRGSSCGISCWK